MEIGRWIGLPFRSVAICFVLAWCSIFFVPAYLFGSQQTQRSVVGAYCSFARWAWNPELEPGLWDYGAGDVM
jgi:hypothetical protein